MSTATVQTPTTTDPLARALARGVAAGLKVYRVAGREDLRFVTSQSEPGLGYLVTLDRDHGASCSCPARSHQLTCKHVALVLADQRPALPDVATMSDDELHDEAKAWDRAAERDARITDAEHERCYAVHIEVARRDGLRYEAEMARRARLADEREARRTQVARARWALFGDDEQIAVAQ